MESIDLFSIKMLWGNLAFDHAVSLSVGLVDLPLGGYSYTWAHKSASKMSKLDRFLISEGLLELFPHLSGLCPDRHLSDHRSIIMFESKLDYGPFPFRMFHSWFKMEGFDKFMEDSWDSMNVMDSNGLIRMKKKLTEVDKLLDRGEGDDEILIQRASLLKDLNDIFSLKIYITSKEALELSQKAKVRWSIEGDENSKYFHGILNSKRSQLSIRGILHDEDWIVDPIKFKTEFLNNFSNRFLKPLSRRISIDFQFSNRLKVEQAAELECTISYDEIKKAVWECGINKSSGS
ncbi:RNA-directed DNA polymerase, eukaryota [Tanacetum coccineum]